MTLQTFVAWKKRKLREKAEQEMKDNEEKKKKMKQGLTIGMSGRDMFTYDPKMLAVNVSYFAKNFMIFFIIFYLKCFTGGR